IGSVDDGALRCCDKEGGRASGKEGIFQFQFSRSIKCNRAQRLRTRPTPCDGGRYGLIKRAERWRLRDTIQDLSRIFFARSELCETGGRRTSKIGLRKPVRGFVVADTGVR